MTTHNHQEFLNWYHPVHEQFTRFCANRAYGTMETADLIQESILATLQAFYRINDKEKLLGYMIGVANNIVRNKKRRLKFRADWEELALEKLETQAPSPEIALDIHYLHKAMEQLPEKQREAIVLFEISGFSMKEISEIQESSLSATKTRISRGRQKLRELLVENGSRLTLSKRLAIYASIMF